MPRYVVGVAGRQAGRVREPGQALCEADGGRRRRARLTRRRGPARALPVLVARRQVDRLRRLDRRGRWASIRTIARQRRRRRAPSPSEPGHYRRPRFSPDGKTIVFEKGDGRQPALDQLVGRSRRLSRRRGGRRRRSRVARRTRSPQFGAAQRPRVHDDGSKKGKRISVSIDLNGEAKRTHAIGRAGQRTMRSRRTAVLRLPRELRGLSSCR